MQSDIACTNQFKCHVNQICSNDIDRWATLKRCFLEIISSLGRGLLGGIVLLQSHTKKKNYTRPNDQTIFVRCCCSSCDLLTMRVCIENISTNLKFYVDVPFSSLFFPNECSSHISTYRLGHSLKGKK